MSDEYPRDLSPQEALRMLEEHPQAILVDIRSSMEYLFVGHPTGAVHVPWQDEPDWVANPDFTRQICKLLPSGAAGGPETASAPVILICRSGKRSLEAGRVLIQDGLKAVYHVNEGFEGDLDENRHRGTTGGWRFRGLPWEQS